jgi:putative tryptophan/tyrosine transport system substrate-binding protein
MKRRDVIAMLGVATVARPLAVLGQQPQMPVIGFLLAAPSDANSDAAAAIRDGLNEVGYVGGQNATFEYRSAESHYDRLPLLADDLVRRRVSVIIAEDVVSAVAAKAATSTIPIVFISGVDPVKLGLVAALNHPEGNLTGVSFFTGGLGAKRLELLRELVPKPTLVAVLVNPKNVNAEAQLDDLREAARAIGQQLLILNVSAERDFNAAFTMLVERRADGLIVGADPMFVSTRDRLVTLAAHSAIPAIYELREMSTAGGLMSYGTSLSEAFRRLGVYTGRILKGAKPADLPIVQPTKFELVINLKTAKALGLTIPPSLIARADEVIE